jgi:hypothetical protein
MAPFGMHTFGVLARLAAASSPYNPTEGWTYYLEAAAGSCPSRFVHGDSLDTKVSLSSAKTEFTLVTSNTKDGAFYLQLSNGKYLSYASPCDETQVDTWPSAGINQEFRFASTTNFFSWKLEAVGRTNCTNAKAISYASNCRDNTLSMGPSASTTAVFHLNTVRNNGKKYDKKANSAIGCADPFAWYSEGAEAFQLVCEPQQNFIFTTTVASNMPTRLALLLRHAQAANWLCYILQQCPKMQYFLRYR